jgi:hypothetical protein
MGVHQVSLISAPYSHGHRVCTHDVICTAARLLLFVQVLALPAAYFQCQSLLHTNLLPGQPDKSVTVHGKLADEA